MNSAARLATRAIEGVTREVLPIAIAWERALASGSWTPAAIRLARITFTAACRRVQDTNR